MSIRKLIWLVVFIPFVTLGQGEMNNWYFGFNAGISFNNDGTVSPLADGAINSYEGCATISNVRGELLFYTDGETVYTRNHAIMANGTGLLGSPSSTQSAIIMAMPEAENLYYVFTIDATNAGIRGSGLNYSIVDISLNSGNGAVIQKNTNLLPDCAEKVAAVIKDCTAKSIWLITLSTETGGKTTPPDKPIFNTFHAFEINPVGISTTAVRSTFTDLLAWDDRGYLKFSVDGTKLASANAASGLFIYDFDATTGIVSNQEQLLTNSVNTDAYGVEFSMNGQYLYVNTSNNIYSLNGQTSSLLQYDLLAPDISSSQVVLDDRDIFRGALQMGINGKIYRALSTNYFNGLPNLGVINNPEENGLAANYEHNGVVLNNSSAQGLPSFVASFFNSVELVENQNTNTNLILCVGDTLALEAQLIAGATYEWEKDGLAFVNANNSYTVPVSSQLDSGNYKVTIVRPGAIDCPIIGEIMVDVAPFPESTTLNWSQCDVEDADATDGIALINLTQVQNNEGLNYLFYLSESDSDLDNPIENPESFINNEPFIQTLFYKVVNENGCEANGLLELNIYPVPESIIDESFVLCEGDILTLEAQLFAGATYEWEKDGLAFVNANNNIYTVPVSTQQDSGTYKVTILRLGALDCPIIGETLVDVAPLPESTTLSWSQCDLEDADATDGIAVINLTQVQNNEGLDYSFYLNESDRDADNPIPNPDSFVNNESFFQTLFYKVVNDNGCEANGLLDLNIYPVPELVMEESFIFCEGDTGFQILAPVGFDLYNWYRFEGDAEVLVATGEVLQNVVGGTYILEGVHINGSEDEELGCTRRFAFEVEVSGPAEIVDLNITDSMVINTIEVVAIGAGDYEYSIDGINYQNSNYVENVPSGSLTVYVRDKNGCGIVETTVEIDTAVFENEFPKFFTPNGDGVNDFWNYQPSDANNDVDISHINIYNRYGRLLIELDPLGSGWDGTVNGQLQPPADYWYRVITLRDSELSGHFSLVFK